MPVNSQSSILFPETNQFQLKVFVSIFSAVQSDWTGFPLGNWGDEANTPMTYGKINTNPH